MELQQFSELALNTRKRIGWYTNGMDVNHSLLGELTLIGKKGFGGARFWGAIDKNTASTKNLSRIQPDSGC